MNNRTYTAKQLVVSAKYVLECAANDAHTHYPVTLFIRSDNGGVTFLLKDSHEIREAMENAAVKSASLIELSDTHRGLYIGIQDGGKLMVDNGIMPERKHGDVLLRPQVKELYSTLTGRH